MAGRFATVMVIGCGKIAGDVLRHVAGLREEYGYAVRFVEHEAGAFSRMRSVCAQTGVRYEQIQDKAALTEQLLALDVPALIVSAGNHYLFPRAVVEKDGVEIINFHNALLPNFPGRNAPSWAIYTGAPVSGATWHYVTPAVDDGAIIAQREVCLSADVKAYELTRSIMDLAAAAFRQFFESLLERHIEGAPQPVGPGARRMYYACEVPGGGKCSIDDPAEDIYRLLRAVDYGKSSIFPPVRIRLADGGEREVLRYEKREIESLPSGEQRGLDPEGKRIYLPLGAGYELVLHCRQSVKEAGRGGILCTLRPRTRSGCRLEDYGKGRAAA